MFCYQCEQTKGGTGCTDFGVCGKDPVVAALQDGLMALAGRLALVAEKLRAEGTPNADAEWFVVESLFTTVTNVSFDPERIAAQIAHGQALCKLLKAHDANLPDCLFDGASSVEEIVEKTRDIAIEARLAELGEDVVGLQELMVYGLKGAAAYYHHAVMLGRTDDQICADLSSNLAYVATNPTDVSELVGKCLGVGELNLRVMGLLDEANTGAYGHPEPTSVRVTAIKGKAIVVSGHDLKDLEELLKQTEGKGINVYTHGEMLPALAYPGLKKYPHLVGNYGGAWQIQASEFKRFPGAILMTTNCIQRPAPEYVERIFTSGLVAWPGVEHIKDRDFSPVIQAALDAPGFEADEEEKRITIGFARNTLMENAGTVIDAIKGGALRRIFLIGGCDGALHGRNYYTELAQQVPDDCVILTLACGKYRFNKLEFGTLGGLPRLMDVGQCNDAYSAIVVASELAKAVGCGVNDLPLSLVLSWYEQKAVAILLTLLHLGLQGIRLGPTLPAFVSPNILKALVDNFNIMPTTTAEQDLAAILG